MKRSILISAGLAFLASCTGSRATTASRSYVPRTREITVTTVPLLVREQQSVFPFLTKDFGRGGVLEVKRYTRFRPAR
jgi:hypothetical protein